MPIDNAKVGRAIAALRQEKGMSQQGLAALMNVTHQAVSKWENGVALPDTQTLLALSKLFGTTMEAILTGEIPRERHGTNWHVLSKAASMQKPETDAAEEPDKADWPDQTEETEEVGRDEDVKGKVFLERDEAESELEFDVLPPDGDERLNFEDVTGMLPFVSKDAADRIFRMLVQQRGVEPKQIQVVAPFVSTGILDEYAKRVSDEGALTLLMTVAPFLSTRTVSALVSDAWEKLDLKTCCTLIPFVDSKTVDKLVLRTLGMDEKEKGDSEKQEAVKNSSTSNRQEARDAVNVKSAAPAVRREDVIMRVALKAVEDGNVEWLEEHADSLNQENLLKIGKLVLERNDEEMLEAVLENAQEEILHELLETATEQGDWEKINFISGYL